MTANNLLATSTVSLSDILGNGKLYKVPAYQRDYSWKQENWEDLWSDILLVMNADTVHYMGSIVLQNKGDKRFSVIDGQQRLATLSLIVLAVIKNIQNLIQKGIDIRNNEERIGLLSKKFLGDKDPGSLTYSAKLELNENNNGFYQSHLMVFRPPLNEAKLRDSDRLLWQAFNYFYHKIAEHFTGSDNGQDLANFLNREIAEKLMFIQIVVEDELRAYTVFETLNSRGERLTVSDLLKNFLFSLATSTDLPHIKEKWQRTVDTIGLSKFPVFLRHYWISRYPLIRQEYLFKAMKEVIKSSIDVINLLDQLEKNAQVYVALLSYSDQLWIGQREQRKRIKELELFKERQALPLLLAAYSNLAPEEFTTLLKVVSVITFRFTIIGGLNPNIKEDIYNKAAIKVSRKQLNTASAIAHEVRPLYTSDNDFENDFATATISTKRSKKLVRYILFEIENHLGSTDMDYEDNPASIEHILPENMSDTWLSNFPPVIYEAFVYRLGNYTLLEDDKNRECGTKSFSEKKEIYQTSQYAMPKQIVAADWTPNTMNLRQDRLAKLAKTVWKLPYYGS
jgi:hypothetical protein